jgi:hypothetical protein
VNIFDADPFVGLLPQWVQRILGLTLVFCLAFVTPARDWFINQAQQHVLHQIQPMLDNLMPPPDSSSPSVPPPAGPKP